MDGIYDSDPNKNPDAVRFDMISFHEAVDRQLGVMDLTAITMCMENDLPIRVFDFKTSGNIQRVIAGDRIGTLVTNQAATA